MKMVLVIVIIAAAAMFLLQDRKSLPAPEDKTGDSGAKTGQEASSNQPVVGGISEAMVKEQAKITVSAPVSSQSTTIAAMPADLGSLISSGSSGLTATAVQYSGGGKGYRIDYQVSGTDVKAFYQKFSQEVAQKGWTPLVSSWSVAFAFFEVQNPNHQARVSIYPEEGKLAVAVEVVEIANQ